MNKQSTPKMFFGFFVTSSFAIYLSHVNAIRFDGVKSNAVNVVKNGWWVLKSKNANEVVEDDFNINYPESDFDYLKSHACRYD